MDFAWAAVAFAATTVLGLSLRATLRVPALLRRNYADREIVTGGGVVALFGFLVAVALLTVADQGRAGWVYDTVVVAVGFGLVGLFDDVVGTHGARGIRGHLTALRRGQLTSGALKLFLGVGVATIATLTTESPGVQLLRVIVIAGSANVGNLLDLAPARAAKSALIALVPLLVMHHSHDYVVAGPLMFVAALVALVPFELREELMLGDAGANALGATVGLGWVLATAHNDAGLVAAAAVVVAINAAGEVISFSDVIDRVGLLRRLDRLGRRA